MTDTASMMQSLYSQFGELPGINIELHKELIAIAVETSTATARIFLQGAQLSEYGLKGQAPTLWLSPECNYLPGQPLRGGIPICWPWFGDLNRNCESVSRQIDDPNAPTHGFARHRNWQLTDIEIPSPEQTRLLLTLNIKTGEEPLWPFASQLQLQVDVGQVLDIQLTTINCDQRPFSFSAALHSYFNISDIDNISLDGLAEKPYTDAQDNWQLKQQQGSLRIDQEVDRIYQQLDQAIVLTDTGHQRSTEVTSQGSHSAIIWNPWIEKSKRLSCFSEDAYQQMLCIETANAQEDYIELQAGQSHSLCARITTLP